MSDIAIHIEKLGKRYRYGGAAPISANLRSDFTEWVKGLFGRSRKPSVIRAHPWKSVAKNVTHRTLHQIHEQHMDADPNYFWALKDINLDIKQGEVVGLIGRNGAGKSTLLKILSRITPPTTGKVTYNGRIASLLEVGTGFHRELTGRENIFLNGSILGMKRAEILKKFDEIVAFAEVEKFIDTPVKFYSSGMYVRLAFAVAAHLETDIMLVDEVLAVGDTAFQQKCLGKMDAVAKSGRTVLFVSHNMSAIKSLCKSGVVLNQGQVACTGKVNEAVGAYTHVNAGQLAQDNPVSVSDQHYARGTRDVQLTRVGVQGLDGAWRRSFAVWEPFRVVLEIENTTASPRDIACWFSITALDGTYLGTSIQYDDADQTDRVVEGHTVLTVSAVCHDNVLKPGEYLLSAGILGKYREILAWCDRLITLEITQQIADRNTLFDDRIGLVVVRSKWAVQSAEGATL